MSTILSENFVAVGTSAGQFFDVLSNFDEHTEYSKTKDVAILTYVGKDNDKLYFEGDGKYTNAETTALKNAGLDELIDEIEETGSPAIMFSDGEVALMTNRAVAEIANSNSLSGSQLMVPGKFRDAYISSLSQNRDLTYILREVNGVKRVMAVRTAGYKPVKMADSFLDVIQGFSEANDVGMYEIQSWESSQDMSSIYIKFPYLAEDIKNCYPNLAAKKALTPGIVIRSNDLGYSSLNVTMIYYQENSDRAFIIGDSVVAKHTSGFSLTEYLKKISEGIFEKFHVMPEALEKSMSVYIGASELDAFVEKLFRHCGIYKVFQRKDNETNATIEAARTHVINTVIANANGNAITAYDVITTVMETPDHVTTSDSYKDLFETACAKAWSVLT